MPSADGRYPPADRSVLADCSVQADLAAADSVARMVDGRYAPADHSVPADYSVQAGSAAADCWLG